MKKHLKPKQVSNNTNGNTLWINNNLLNSRFTVNDLHCNSGWSGNRSTMLSTWYGHVYLECWRRKIYKKYQREKNLGFCLFVLKIWMRDFSKERMNNFWHNNNYQSTSPNFCVELLIFVSTFFLFALTFYINWIAQQLSGWQALHIGRQPKTQRAWHAFPIPTTKWLMYAFRYWQQNE